MMMVGTQRYQTGWRKRRDVPMQGHAARAMKAFSNLLLIFPIFSSKTKHILSFSFNSPKTPI